MSNLIGKVLLSQFRVDAFIAAGGMGSVYRVWDIKRNVELAMKVLHADFADDPSAFKYFQREARALEKLRHPNIVPFYGIYQDGQQTFLLEQYVDGPTLRDILNKQPRGLPLRDTMTVMKALCPALGYAHANGVIHCDIKPGNVMLDSGGQIYLADFGIARHAESATTTIAGAGTPAYMAPEQVRGMSVNAQTDVYSLGILLFEMLTGQRPFRGDEPQTMKHGNTSGERIRYAHLYLAPPNPSVINQSISREVSAVIQKALQKQPGERYYGAVEFLQALSAAVGQTHEQTPVRLNLHGAISSERISKNVPEPAGRKPSSKNAALWVMLGIIFILAVIGMGMFLPIIVPPIATLLPPTVIQQDPTLPPTEYIPPPVTEIIPPTDTPTEPPTFTPTPTATSTETPTATPTKEMSCPGAEPQRVVVRDRVYVCTQTDRLIVKKTAGKDGIEMFRIYPGSSLTIVGGPICDDNSSWWQVNVPADTKASKGQTALDDYYYIVNEKIGWVREGSDNKDPYYICKQ